MRSQQIHFGPSSWWRVCQWESVPQAAWWTLCRSWRCLACLSAKWKANTLTQKQQQQQETWPGHASYQKAEKGSWAVSPVLTALSRCIPCTGFCFIVYAGLGGENLVRIFYEKKRIIDFFKNCPKEVCVCVCVRKYYALTLRWIIWVTVSFHS